MITLELIQGSPEWHVYRATARNASEAAAAIGCHPTITRTQLLDKRKTGLAKEHSSFVKERVFARGHAIEDQMRPKAEAIIDEDLYPVVAYSMVGGIELSASFDGVTFLEDTIWECKSLNDRLRAVLTQPGPDGNDARLLPKHYRVQLEQQCAVSACDRVLFTASDGKGDDRHCWYTPDYELRAEIVCGWVQFEKDFIKHIPVEVIPAAVAAPVMSLPAVSVRISGELSVISNLDVFQVKLLDFIGKIDREPTTDQSFADAEAAVKTLKKAEDALEAAEAAALGETVSIEQMRTLVSFLKDTARVARLDVSKKVEARKLAIRSEQVQRGRDALAQHVAGLKARFDSDLMPVMPEDFAGCIKGLKTVDSIAGKIDDEIARCKINANALADKIAENLETIKAAGADMVLLFADRAHLVLKSPEDLEAVVQSRVVQHKAAEAAKQEATRERIRAEEVARLERKARLIEAADQHQIAQETQAVNVVAMPARHEPLFEKEAKAMWAGIEDATKLRAELMPTEEDAAYAMWSAWYRLKELGWKETMYGPTNVTVQLIEPGSSGIHQGQRWKPWPEKLWWIDGDSPSNPCLFKPLKNTAP